jgi:hypothetical protein
MTDREPGWLGRQFRGVDAADPTRASPERAAWAMKLTYVAMAVGLLVGLVAGFVASSRGVTGGAAWAVGWGTGIVVIFISVIVGRLVSHPPP